MERPLLLNTRHIVVCGHVDDGKSTLLGRLLYDTSHVPAAKKAELEAISRRRGMDLEWSFLLDALQAERDQAITIDSSQVVMTLAPLRCVFIDVPGHLQFFKNMAMGAARADAAVVMIDVCHGLREQTRRHLYLLQQVLGIQDILIVINKMDTQDYAQAPYAAIVAELQQWGRALGWQPEAVLPISAKFGENLTTSSSQMPWYQGPTLCQWLTQLPNPQTKAAALPTQVWVQAVYKFDQERILAGKVVAGALRVGETLLFSPIQVRARVKALLAWPHPVTDAVTAGQTVGIVLEEDCYVPKGAVASGGEDPPALCQSLQLTTLWLGAAPLTAGTQVTLQLGFQSVGAWVKQVECEFDPMSCQQVACTVLLPQQLGRVVLQTQALCVAADHASGAALGTCSLHQHGQICGMGWVSLVQGQDLRPMLPVAPATTFAVPHQVLPLHRQARNGHHSGVVWLTGLSGAGKSTLSMLAERKLFQLGYQVFTLDGDNIRQGLSADLNFTTEDRAENVRRVAEVARLFSDAGFICLTAFISPYAEQREVARRIVGEHFFEVYIAADPATCAARDPKGLYRLAQDKQLTDFTGVDAPYEPPMQPDLVIDTVQGEVVACVDQLVAFIQARFTVQPADRAESTSSGEYV